VSIDSYMNIQLSGAEEWIDQHMTSVLGQVLIRYVKSRFGGGETGSSWREPGLLDIGAFH